ncbi:sterol desaturase family protein [Phormidesmis priestleyi ULC007]|uniref:Sterol desaturase family protein n=1 Tax=Phormidesmis priestleyi ULC007 TaxID=1920490 RepID=A0A2T1DB77_9CYAN|nr:sterol desaturase family protein [Phormidesmis priestleyi]PSB17726.1 sterol desaturase family protein [Phormidesmis priestleyi ULC007]PZO48667.1 MAG: sterol desaturase family protein [Phormidesmis priestleyi]
MVAYFSLVSDRAVEYIKMVAIASFILIIFELLFPGEKQSFKSKLKGAYFWIVYILITVALQTLIEQLLLINHYQSLFHLNLSELSQSQNSIYKAVGLILLPFIPYLVADLFYYWFHRLQHSNHFFWQFHSVHHSLREMSAFNDVHHFSEEIFRIPLMIIPLKLLVEIDIGETMALFILLRGWGQLIHSNTSFNFGKLQYLFVDPHFHRIHHSRFKEHRGKNYSAAFSLWDVLFGTGYFPKKGEYPPTGLDYVGEPANLQEFLFRPFSGKMVRSGSSLLTSAAKLKNKKLR